MTKKTPAKTTKGTGAAKHTQAHVNAHVIGGNTDSFELALLKGVGNSTKNTEQGAIQSNALEYEDEFKGMYSLSDMTTDSTIVIEPPFNPLTLEKIVKHNNTLGPCIDAMKINVHGTGYEILSPKRSPKGEAADEEDEDKKALEEFFAEPWPGESFQTIRKKLGNNIESVGWGCLEVIENAKGEMMFIRHIEAKTTRLVKLGAAHATEQTVRRRGKEVKVTVGIRHRKFVQKIGRETIYFKEFGAQRDLDKETGEWAPEGKTLPYAKRASSILYFTKEQDINTPYGVPRWIGQLPSVLGSRKAEENNLSFFDSGGIPPFILIVQGGILAQETKDALELALNANSNVKQRGLVVEAHSSSGSLDDKGNNVQVQVERFGGANTTDSQFEAYDEKCHLRVRSSFRLGPIFLGRSENYNFASAYASFMVGEAQVFKPEREEFDEIVNLKLIPAILGKKHTGYKFRSLPINLTDVKEKIMATKMAADKQAITKGELLRNLNELANMEMVIADGEDCELCAANQRANQEGITSDSAITEANTSDPMGPQGSSDSKV